jgi:ATP-binding cassette subfamily B protein
MLSHFEDKLEKPALLILIGIMPVGAVFYFLAIICITLFATIGEIIVISSIQPFISNMTGDSTEQNNLLAKIFSKIEIGDNEFLTIAILSICIASTCRLALIWMNIDFTNKLSEHLSNLLMQSILAKDLKFFKERSSDEIISAFALKIGNVSSTILAFTNLVTSVIITIGISIAVLSAQISYTLQAMCAMIILYLLILVTLRNRINRNGALIANKQSQLISICQSAIGSIRDILLNKTPEPYVQSYTAELKKLNRASAFNTFFNQSPRFVLEAIFIIGVMIIGTLYQVSNSGTAFIGSLAVLALAAQRIIPLMQQSYSAIANLFASDQAINDVLSFLEPQVTERKQTKNNNDAITSIQLIDISFGYSSSKVLFSGVSQDISVGDFLIIKGETGSGKSTLLDIILGFLSPNNGKVVVNGFDDLKHEKFDFSGKVAFVPQKIFILNSSIRDNVIFNLGVQSDAAEDNSNDTKVIDCCRAALFFDEEAPSDFLNTQCGENGSKLSGGQIQRLALARALYQNPDLMVLDEFGSALDKATLRKVIVNIKTKFKDKIVIFVTHSDVVEQEASKTISL